MRNSLTGEVAIITGAGRGVGRAIARSFARAGAAVAIVARTASELDETAELVRKEGGKAAVFSTDVTDGDAVNRLAQIVESELGPVTTLVNNAGTCRAIGPLWEVDAADWRLDVESSLLGTFVCTRAVLERMVERRTGRIINVASYAAIRPSPHMAAYGCAKAALVHLTNSLAAETAEFGISIFAITPGRVRTAMTEYILESPAGRRWLQLDLDDWITPERAADLAVFLASGRADVLSGRFVHVLDEVRTLVDRAAEIRRDDLYVLRLRK